MQSWTTRLTFTAVIVSATTAWAQQPAPPQYTLTLTGAEIALIGTALGARPYSEVAPLVAKIQQQILDAEKKGAPPPKTPEQK